MQTILCMRVAISNPVVTKSFVACQLEDNCIVAGEEPPEMWLNVAVCLQHMATFRLSLRCDAAQPYLQGCIVLLLQTLAPDITEAMLRPACLLLLMHHYSF